MNCETCHVDMVERVTTVQAPHAYTLSGLDHVLLLGIRVFRCATCGDEVPELPRPLELHRLIADNLLRKPSPLSGKEVRFLRKTVGQSAKQLAELVGIDPAHLSRVENDHYESLGQSTDRLVRLHEAPLFP